MIPDYDPADLMAQAASVAEQAYAPYSNFPVGAVVVADDGRQFIGVNVENAAYGSTICAEGAAISAAATAGVRHITTVAVAGGATPECYPCGNCRQLMVEFGVGSVIIEAPDGLPRVHSLAELLPLSFGPDSLESGSETG